MQQFTINIPDNKISFFQELIENLGFKAEKKLPENVLTDDQKALVDKERMKIKEDPSHFINWEDARKTLKTK